jgi:hypothetical protein
VQDSARAELQLTAQGTSSTRSAFILPDLDPGVAINAFSAKWNSQVYGGGGTNGKADGFSLTLGSVPSSDFLVNEAFSEVGPGRGLTFSVATYDFVTCDDQSCRTERAPGYRIISDGVELGFVNKSGADWGNFSTYRNTFEVDWRREQGLSARVNGVPIFTNQPTGDFTPDPGMKLFYMARTGGQTEEFRLDNIAVVTGGTLSRITTSDPFGNGVNPSGEGPAQAFDGNLSTKWLTFTNSGFVGARTADRNPRTVTGYALVTGNDAPDRHPSTWALEGSNDGSNWFVIDRVSGHPLPESRINQQNFLVDSPGAYSFYRVNVSATNGSPHTQLMEVVLYETLVAVPEPSSALLLTLASTLFYARRRNRPISRASHTSRTALSRS